MVHSRRSEVSHALDEKLALLAQTPPHGCVKLSQNASLQTPNACADPDTKHSPQGHSVDTSGCLGHAANNRELSLVLDTSYCACVASCSTVPEIGRASCREREKSLVVT